MQTPEFTPEQQAYIDDLRNTLRGEMEAGAHSSKSTIESVLDLERDALDALQHTLKHSGAESLRAKVAMWVIDTKLNALKAGDDPLAKFLEGLQAATAK